MIRHGKITPLQYSLIFHLCFTIRLFSLNNLSFFLNTYLLWPYLTIPLFRRIVEIFAQYLFNRGILMTKSELIKRYTLFIISLFFSALGVSFTKHGELGVSPTSSIANVILNSGEAFVKAVSDTTHISFSNMKIIFDVACVVISVLLSLVFFQFKIVGTREGTIISALCTGMVVKFFTKWLAAPLNRILADSDTSSTSEVPQSVHRT